MAFLNKTLELMFLKLKGNKLKPRYLKNENYDALNPA